MKPPAKLIIKKYLPWFIFAVALFLIHWRYELNSDEGVVLNAAWDIIQGKKMYFDTFEFMAPGAAYLIAGLWKLVGASYTSARILSLVILYSGVIGLYVISRELGIKRWRYFASMLFIVGSAFWQPIHYNAFNTVATIWALYFIIRAFQKNIFYFWLLSGFCSGLALIFLQHKGLALLGILGSIILVLSVSKKIPWRSLLYFSIAASLPVIVCLLYWPPHLLWNDTVLFPLNHYEEVNTVPLFLWSGCLASVLLLSAIVVYSAKNETKIILTTLLLTGIFQLLASLPRADATHVLQALTAFLPIVALLFEQCLTKIQDFQITASAWSLGVLLLILNNPPFVPSASLVLKALHTYCPEITSIYAGPFMPGLYFETRAHNPTPYSFLITRHNTEAQFTNAAILLAKNPPRCAVVNYAVVNKFAYNKNNPVDEFINSHYSFAGEFRNIKILVRN